LALLNLFEWLANLRTIMWHFGLFVARLGVSGIEDQEGCGRRVYTQEIFIEVRGGVGKTCVSIRLWVVEGGSLTPFVFVMKCLIM